MQIAIPGMKNIGNTNVIAFGDVADVPQHLGEARARDHPILHIVARADPPHGAKGPLTTEPEQLALTVIFGDTHLARLMLAGDLGDLHRGLFDAVLRIRRTTTLVTMPSVPSEPTTMPVRS